MSKKKSVLESNLAALAFSAIEEEGSSYISEIARNSGKSQTSIDRIVRKMYESEFLEKESRGRAKYYSIDYDAIIECWLSNLEDETESPSQREKMAKKAIEGSEKFTSNAMIEKLNEKINNDLDGNRESIKKFSKDYLRAVLQKNPENTNLNEIMYIGLYIDLIKFKFDHPNEFPNYLEPLNQLLKRKIDIFTLSYEIEDIAKEFE